MTAPVAVALPAKVNGGSGSPESCEVVVTPNASTNSADVAEAYPTS